MKKIINKISAEIQSIYFADVVVIGLGSVGVLACVACLIYGLLH